MSMIDVKGRTSKGHKSVRKPLRDLPTAAKEKPKSSNKLTQSSKWKLTTTTRPVTSKTAEARSRLGTRFRPQNDTPGRKAKFSLLISFVKNTAIVISLVVGLGATIYFGRELVLQASSRPINSIGIEGNFVYLDKQSVSDMIAPMIKAGFLQMPLSEIKTKLEQNPWIENALVSRRWPDTLYVSITEQEPIARWSQVGFLNAKGEVVFVKQTAQLANLPLLGGEASQANRVMQDFQELTQLLRPYDLAVKEFYCDELSSWSVVLDNDIVITLGRDQLMDKLQRFLTVYATSLQSQIDLVTGVDLRYGNGVAVKWKENATVDGATLEKKRVPHA